MYKGIFVNLTTESSAVYLNNLNMSSLNGVRVVNSSFENMEGLSFEPPCIEIASAYSSTNITDCTFRTIISTYDRIRAGAVYYSMHTTNGDYKFSGNAFFNVSSHRSALALYGSFSSLIFENNSFVDVAAQHEGGVSFITFLFLLLCFIIF
jgi:hypothetical protein